MVATVADDRHRGSSVDEDARREGYGKDHRPAN